jgi:hypothetical protein
MEMEFRDYLAKKILTTFCANQVWKTL